MTISIGAFLNAAGILLGGLFGLAWRQPISARTQIFFRNALGAFTIFFGLRLVWLSVGGNFLSILEQLFLATLAVMLGYWTGKLFGLQKISNHLGRFAANLISSEQSSTSSKTDAGFTACSILFCAAPLGILGAVTDGLSGYFYPLVIKAVMDGLAMAGFMKIFRWTAALSALPVFIFLSAITLASRFAAPFLNSHGLTHSVNAAAGLIVCAIALVVFEARKVELANYLPAIFFAAILEWIFRPN